MKTVTITFSHNYQDLSKTYTTKSAMIRYLDSIGMKRTRIAQELSAHYGKTMRYQHVRNVLTQEVKYVTE